LQKLSSLNDVQFAKRKSKVSTNDNMN